MSQALEFSRLMFRVMGGSRRRIWRKLEKLIENEVPILAAFEELASRRLKLHGKGDVIYIALRHWIGRMKNGLTLAEATRGWISHEEAMLLQAGEASGGLQTALQSIDQIMQAKNDIRAAVFGGLAYPIFLMCAGIGLLHLFAYKVIPVFTNVLPAEKWVGLPALMVKVSTYTQIALPWVVGSFLILVVLFVISLPRWDGPARVFLDRYAPYSVYRIMQGSAWLISLAALVKSGKQVIEGLDMVAGSANPWMRRRIEAAARGIRSGLNLGDALVKANHGFPDGEIIDDLGVYSRISGLNEALDTLGREWITESVEAIKGQMRIVFSMSLMFVGGMLIFMVSGLFAMQIQLAQAIQMSTR